MNSSVSNITIITLDALMQDTWLLALAVRNGQYDVPNYPKDARLMPGCSDVDWGAEYISWDVVNDQKSRTIFVCKPNWQNIPKKYRN